MISEKKNLPSYAYRYKLLKLEKKDLALLKDFSEKNKVNFFATGMTVKKKQPESCCNNAMIRIVNYYRGITDSFGKINFCCEKVLTKELIRINRRFKTSMVRKSRISYYSSYKAIRGSVGHIIFQAFLGKNEAKYVRESSNIKENSLLRRIYQITAPCPPEIWDQTISDFAANPSKAGVEKIICLYSPLYRQDSLVIKKMAQEIISYLVNLPKDWNKANIRIVPTHVGMPDLIVDDKIVEFKFLEKKIGLRKSHFRQLYRYYRSACRVNPEEKKKLKSLVVLSPITGEMHEMTIAEADKKWNLKADFSQDFDLWQNDNYLNFLRLSNNVLKGKIKSSETMKKRLKNSGLKALQKKIE